MERFIQLHILTNYPASNLNRDDLGRPKTVIMGNSPRLRVSSQSLKRAWRTSDVFKQALDGALGVRTKAMGENVYLALTLGLPLAEVLDGNREPGSLPKLADKKALDIAVEIAGVFGKTKSDKQAKQDAQQQADEGGAVPDEDVKEKARIIQSHIEQLAHFGPVEIERIAELTETCRADGKKPDKDALDLLRKRTGAADVAMFGRMLAASKPFNVEAAVQVAHAVTVHTALVEDDFFTAVDDLNRDESGAGHMGVFEFGAGLFYLYVCVDRELLLENLGGDAELEGKALEALCRAACTISPSGKQNSFASRAYAAFCLAEKGNSQPRSLASAYLDGGGWDGDMIGDAVHRLLGAKENMDQVYGPDFTSESFDASTGQGSLDAVCAFVRGQAMARYLVFQIYGPMQSWGVTAVGEIRPTHPRPTRSAVMGLLAGALGIRRHEEARHRELDESYAVSVKPLCRGGRMTDYHTSQCGKIISKRPYRVRSDEVGGLIGCDEDYVRTILSRREYLVDTAFAVCVRALGDDPPYTPEAMGEALSAPRFAPYLGRKSCPPALPFKPVVGDFDSPLQALAAYGADDCLKKVGHKADGECWLDERESREAHGEIERAPLRDMPLSRVRRQFGLRDELRARLPESQASTEADHVHEQTDS